MAMNDARGHSTHVLNEFSKDTQPVSGTWAIFFKYSLPSSISKRFEAAYEKGLK